MEYIPLRLHLSNLKLYNPRLYEDYIEGQFKVPFGRRKGEMVEVRLSPEQVREVREEENVAFVKPHVYKGDSGDGTEVLLYMTDETPSENRDYQQEYGEYTISW